MSAYSARPSRSGMGSKVPMQPRRRWGRPGREGRVFQVTKSGLGGSRRTGSVHETWKAAGSKRFKVQTAQAHIVLFAGIIRATVRMHDVDIFQTFKKGCWMDPATEPKTRKVSNGAETEC